MLWLAVAALALRFALPVSPPGEVRPVFSGGACILSEAGGAPCPCAALGADLRLALGLPLPLASATTADLERLPGVGPVRAAAIVTERARAPFRRVSDLVRVPGLGPKTAARLEPWLFPGTADPCRN